MKLHKRIWAVSTMVCAVLAIGYAHTSPVVAAHRVTIHQTVSGSGTTDPGYPDGTTVI